MAQHLLIGDLAGPADRPRAHRAAPAAAARGPRLRLAAGARQPAGRAAALGAQPLPLAPLGALRGGARRARCCTSPSTRASSASGWRCGCRWSGRCRSRPGSATGRSSVYIVVVRLLEAVLANVLIWSGTVLYPDYAPGEAEWEIGAARRPGRGGQRDDDLDRRRHARRSSPGSSFAPPTAAPRSRSCSSSPRRAASSSTRARRARGRRRPGRAPARADPRRRRVSERRSATASSTSLVFVVGIATPRRRDRGGAADGAVLRRLDDRLGEHDRRRPGRALDRLLARRPARRPLPGRCAASASWWCSRRVLLALVPLVAQPFFDLSVDALDEIEAGAFVGSLFAVLFLIAIPVGAARHLLAVGDPARGPRRRARRAASPGACTRSRPSARCSGRCSRRSS